MKDLEGGFGIEKKCVTGDFCKVFRIFWGKKWVELLSLLFFFPAPPRRMKGRGRGSYEIQIRIMTVFIAHLRSASFLN